MCEEKKSTPVPLVPLEEKKSTPVPLVPATATSTGRSTEGGKFSRRLCVIAMCFLSVLLNISSAHAEKAPPPEESCADGYYSGPRAGRKNYSHDKYIWVVTPEFAKRFCMPPEFADKDLKGAEAIAFRMSTRTGMFDRCAVSDGKEACAGDNELRFDIFLRSDLNLPAANPEVKFYDGSWDDAGWHIARFGPGKSVKPPGDRYRTGEYKLPPGKIPHFQNPSSTLIEATTSHWSACIRARTSGRLLLFRNGVTVLNGRRGWISWYCRIIPAWAVLTTRACEH